MLKLVQSCFVNKYSIPAKIAMIPMRKNQPIPLITLIIPSCFILFLIYLVKDLACKSPISACFIYLKAVSCLVSLRNLLSTAIINS